jgi:hypothetical protein
MSKNVGKKHESISRISRSTGNVEDNLKKDYTPTADTNDGAHKLYHKNIVAFLANVQINKNQDL